MSWPFCFAASMARRARTTEASGQDFFARHERFLRSLGLLLELLLLELDTELFERILSVIDGTRDIAGGGERGILVCAWIWAALMSLSAAAESFEPHDTLRTFDGE